MNWVFSTFVVIFAFLDPGTDPLTWLNPDQIRIRNTDYPYISQFS